MANNITISKGSYSVTIYASKAAVADNYTNKLFQITPPQTKDNQTSGPSESRTVDLLRITHQMVIKGFITGTDTKTAIEVKQELVNIWKGAEAQGGEVSLTYDGNASGFGNAAATDTNPISGYIEKVTFTDDAMDEPTDFVSAKENYADIVKYGVSITFLEGVEV